MLYDIKLYNLQRDIFNLVKAIYIKKQLKFKIKEIFPLLANLKKQMCVSCTYLFIRFATLLRNILI